MVWAQSRTHMHSHAPIQRIACCNSPSKHLCSRLSQMSKDPALLAIVAVPPSKAVSCQAPGCGHRVYAAVHVVEDAGQTLVLGSTCYAKRYGASSALGSPSYTSGGSGGKALTDEERDLLAANAAELVQRFRDAHEAQLAAARAQLQAQRARPTPFAIPARPPAPSPPQHPWPWQHKRNTSVALVRGPDDQNWVRVQHHNGSQMLVPWPVFDGWDEALPPVCGIPDLELQAYAVPNIVEALQSMRRIGFAPPEVTSWPDIMKLAPVPRAGN